jgi:hypothetical protein
MMKTMCSIASTPNSARVGLSAATGMRFAKVVDMNMTVNSGSMPPPGSEGPTRIAVLSHCGAPGSDS